MNNEIYEKIKWKIIAGWIFQPILFLWWNDEMLNKEINDICLKLFSDFEVDKNSFYKLENNDEKIKISQVREFISKSSVKSSFKFQIFLIENISRMNTEWFNASLKFLEEPGVWNIVFLTNKSESWVLDTILSRVVIINLDINTKSQKNEFFDKMINDYTNKKNLNLISYFFNDKKIEKQDYIDFLETFLLYIKTHLIYTELISQIEESLNLILKNNVLPKYEIDKIIAKI